MKINPSINTLRFLLCCIVIVTHSVFSVPGHPFINSLIAFCKDGEFAVDIFFVISGFFITYGLVKDKTANKNKVASVKAFYSKRFFRIFPIYYLLLAILLFI